MYRNYVNRLLASCPSSRPVPSMADGAARERNPPTGPGRLLELRGWRLDTDVLRLVPVAGQAASAGNSFPVLVGIEAEQRRHVRNQDGAVRAALARGFSVCVAFTRLPVALLPAGSCFGFRQEVRVFGEPVNFLHEFLARVAAVQRFFLRVLEREMGENRREFERAIERLAERVGGRLHMATLRPPRQPVDRVLAGVPGRQVRRKCVRHLAGECIVQVAAPLQPLVGVEEELVVAERRLRVAAGQQQVSRDVVGVLAGDQQRRVAHNVARVHVDAELDEDLQQQVDDVRVPAHAGVHQRRVAVAVRPVHVNQVLLETSPHGPRTALDAGVVQRRPTHVVLRVDVGAGAQEDSDHPVAILLVVEQTREHQRRPTEHVLRVDVHVVLVH